MLTALIVLILTIVLYVAWRCKTPNNFPPGPKRWPIVGNLMDMPSGLHLHEVMAQWSHYGQIIGLNILNTLTVIVSGADNVLAALRKDEFQDRPDNFGLRDSSFGRSLGIFFGNGEQWQSTRKFTIKHMKAYARLEKENLISDEINQLMDTIKEGTMKVTGFFGVAAVNVIWRTISSNRLDMEDEKAQRFLHDVYLRFRQGSPFSSGVVNLCPPLRHLSSTYKFSISVIRTLQQFIREAIQEHRENLDPNNPRDLIDHYLIEMDGDKGNPLFTEEDLITVGKDLFQAGAESTSNSIEFLLLYMILHPEVQEKMQQELDTVLGRSRRPVLDDRNMLPYMMAVLTEVERINPVAPVSVPHSCARDTTFLGYTVPKGTTILLDMWSLGHDPKYWVNPEEFNPGRFLDKEGKFTKSQIFHPFGLGSRVCVGEMFARNIIFLFAATFFEKFSVSIPSGSPRPATRALTGFTTAPHPFCIAVTARY